jgi:predicted nucleic acid-binding protein
VIAALSSWHEQHEEAARALRTVTSLPAHVTAEAYSVLTRLPSGLAVPAATAASVLSGRFGGRPLRLTASEQPGLLQRLAVAGVYGGATYDGLVALEAAAHELTLITLDKRAMVTYQRLGVPVRDLSS